MFGLCWRNYIKIFFTLQQFRNVKIKIHFVVLPGDDEAQRKVKRRVAPPLEENVYYISLAEIQKRTVRVSDLPAFVTEKTMAYYEEEFDVS